MSHGLDFTELGVALDLTIVEWPIAILDQEVRVLRSQMIPFMKVAWQHYGGDDATWEHEDLMRNLYPHLFGKCALFLHLSCIIYFHSHPTHVSPFLLHSPLGCLYCVCSAPHTTRNFGDKIR